jgi:hypothetical protein
MTNENYAEYFKFCSPESIMVVTWYNKLKEIYCPFTVSVKIKVGNLIVGQKAKVTSVKLSSNGKTVFIILGQAYYYNYFDILLESV